MYKAALGRLEVYFRQNPVAYQDMNDRRMFCHDILRGGRVICETPSRAPRRVRFYFSMQIRCPIEAPRQGLFRSPLVLAALRIHAQMVQNAVDVPGLGVSDFAYGAIGLASSAVCCILSILEFAQS